LKEPLAQFLSRVFRKHLLFHQYITVYVPLSCIVVVMCADIYNICIYLSFDCNQGVGTMNVLRTAVSAMTLEFQ
jgi:hypothetical protein